MSEKIVGGLLGLACGDALGAPAEFNTVEYIRSKWGTLRDMVGGGIWEPGEWTDDTAMALCVAEGIIADPTNPSPGIGESFLSWYRSRPKDVGNTIRDVLSSYNGDWVRASSRSHGALTGKAAGNGSLMRTLPVALAYPNTNQMLKESARVSALTHWDSQAEICCAIYCLWIRNLLSGEELREGWQNALSTAKSLAMSDFDTEETPGIGAVPPELWNRLESIEEKTIDEIQPTGYAGYVLDCLEAAVWCCLKSKSLEETLVCAVNLGGEADTIAAVAGGAAGVFYGLESIPERWLIALLKRDALEAIGVRLAKLHSHNSVYTTTLGLPKFEYDQVAEQIYLGRNPLTTLDIEELLNLGITHILDLREEKEWTSHGKFGQEALNAMNELRVTRLHLPILDTGVPSNANFDEAERVLNIWLSDPKHSVFVHCRAGQERSAVIVVAYFAKRNGLTYDQALKQLKSKRPKINPLPWQKEAAMDWLENCKP